MDFLPNYDISLLAALKRAQGDEAHYVAIHNMQAYHLDGFSIKEAYDAIAAHKGVRIRGREASLEPALDNLEEHSLIRAIADQGLYQVTHSGWYYREIKAKEVTHILITGVLLPFIVSIITTLITIALTK